MVGGRSCAWLLGALLGATGFLGCGPQCWTERDYREVELFETCPTSQYCSSDVPAGEQFSASFPLEVAKAPFAVESLRFEMRFYAGNLPELSVAVFADDVEVCRQSVYRSIHTMRCDLQGAPDLVRVEISGAHAGFSWQAWGRERSPSIRQKVCAV